MTIGVQCERDDALRDVQALVTEYGMPVEVHVRTEGDVRRDEYGSIKSLSTSELVFTIGAYPYTHSPSSRQLEKAGLREECDLLIYTAMKDWIDHGITDPWAFDVERCTIASDGMRFKIRERSHQSEFGDVELYMVLGLKRI